REKPVRVLLLLALLPAAYATSLVVAKDWPTMRSMTALAPVAAVLWLRAADGYGRLLGGRLRSGGPALAGCLALLAALSAFNSVLVYFGRRQQEELGLVASAVRSFHVQPGKP